MCLRLSNDNNWAMCLFLVCLDFKRIVKDYQGPWWMSHYLILYYQTFTIRGRSHPLQLTCRLPELLHNMTNNGYKWSNCLRFRNSELKREMRVTAFAVRSCTFNRGSWTSDQENGHMDTGDFPVWRSTLFTRFIRSSTRQINQNPAAWEGSSPSDIQMQLLFRQQQHRLLPRWMNHLSNAINLCNLFSIPK